MQYTPTRKILAGEQVDLREHYKTTSRELYFEVQFIYSQKKYRIAFILFTTHISQLPYPKL